MSASGEEELSSLRRCQVEAALLVEAREEAAGEEGLEGGGEAGYMP